ncbi:ABC transporter ATP-binding protein/permease [Fulvivirga ulvae]|uniref:ATP-binding cassette domain-containing protein n=1 Tax=Fulvivirga ulvae TaxID=2904245 RepID=UPI001F1DC2CC|nr:ABC transporter ATP-binding protein [Fulvivirga ulvae]UII34356.1 ABC transporter ATP-binding protein/permease [Fulvivirga ulvae]
MLNLWVSVKKTYHIIPDCFKKQAIWSLFLTLFNGLLDIISLAAIIPIILIFINPEQITGHSILASLYEQLDIHSEFNFQIIALSALVALFLVKNLVSVWVNYYISKLTFDISTNLSRRSLQHFFSQNYLEFTKSNSAIVSRKIKTIPHDFASYMLTPQLNLITESIVAGIIIAGICLYNPVICMLLIAVMLPILFTWKWFKNQHLQHIEEDFRNTYPVSLKYLLQGVDGYIDVKIYQKEDFFIEKFIGLKHQMNRNYAYLKTASFLPAKFLEVILALSIALIFGYSLFFELSGGLVPLLSLFIAGFYRLYPSTTKIINALTNIKVYNYVLEELNIDEHDAPADKNETLNFNNHVQLQKVSFKYPGKEPLFDNLSLEFMRGQCIGISGASGSGKTTLIKLLTGLITPDSGRIYIDNEQLTENNKTGWLAHIGYLQQQPVIIDATLEENIAFGEHEVNTIKLNDVIRKANLESFINSLPDGLTTQLGENGVQVSGGQKQRIALARALYRNSELFIFDEVSNNLDKANLLEVRTSIKRLLASGKTVVVIDHDLTLLEIADKIWRVTDGQVHETTLKADVL